MDRLRQMAPSSKLLATIGAVFVITLVIVLAIFIIRAQNNNNHNDGGHHLKLTRCDKTNTTLDLFTVDCLPVAPSDKQGAGICHLRRNTATLDIQVKFKASTPFTTMRSSIAWDEFVFTDDACKNGLACPSNANQKQKLTWRAKHAQSLTVGPVNMTLRLKPEDKAPDSTSVLCVQFAAWVIE